jgi:signal transduction histidine kinase
LTQFFRVKQIEIENHFHELLTATVSHEMRTPLNSILTLLSTLRLQITNPKGLELLEIISSSSLMLQCLVNDMLDIFQIKQGKFKKNE